MTKAKRSPYETLDEIKKINQIEAMQSPRWYLHFATRETQPMSERERISSQGMVNQVKQRGWGRGCNEM